MSLIKPLISELDMAAATLTSYLRGSRDDTIDVSQPTAMMIPGYVINAPSLRGLAAYLRRSGYNTDRKNYPFWRHLKVYEKKAEENLDRICQKTGERISILGHSQGGLVAISLGKRFPNKVDKVVSLGVPYDGTYVAYLNYFVPGARDMVPGSDYLRGLQAREFPEGVRFFSVYSPWDEAVIPRDSSKLPGARDIVYGSDFLTELLEEDHLINIKVGDVAHGALIGKRCYSLVERILRL